MYPFRDNGSRGGSSPEPIVLADDTEPEPDLSVLRRRPVPYKEREADAADVGKA